MKIILSILLASIISFASITDDTSYKFVSNTEEEKTVTIDELCLIYFGKIKSWNDGTKIKVFIRPFNDYIQKKSIIEILGVSIGTFKERVNNNKDIKIVEASNILNVLSNTIGSIGIISDTQVILSTDKGLKIIDLVEY